MVPADGLQRPKAVGHVNGFVPDLPKVAGAITAENLENLVRSARAGQAHHCRIRRRYFPAGGLASGPPPAAPGRWKGPLPAPILSTYARPAPEGSHEWEILYQKTREEVFKRRFRL